MAEDNRQVLDVDVLYVGAGSACLSGALHLKKLTVNAGLDISIAIIDKSREIGAHSLSGAIIDPRSLNELIPDHLEKGVPFEAKVTEENMYYLSSHGKFRFPFVPKSMSHHGCYVASLGKFTRWLGKICDDDGIDIFCGFSQDTFFKKLSGRQSSAKVQANSRFKNLNKKENHFCIKNISLLCVVILSPFF